MKSDLFFFKLQNASELIKKETQGNLWLYLLLSLKDTPKDAIPSVEWEWGRDPLPSPLLLDSVELFFGPHWFQ